MKRLLTTLCFCHWSGLAAAQAVLGGANIPTQPQRPPAQSIGNESNWYIDWTSGNVFGPKTSGQWPQTPLATFNLGPGIYNLTGIIYGNGTSAATAIAPGSGVAAALGQAVNSASGFLTPTFLGLQAPNIWYNPCASIDQQFVGNYEPVYNVSGTQFVADRWDEQQITASPHVSVQQFSDPQGGCATSLRMQNGFSSTSTNTVPSSFPTSLTFAVNGGLNFVAGETVTAAVAANIAVTVTGTVTSYNTSTGALVLSVTSASGSGSYTGWVIGVVGTTTFNTITTTATGTSGANAITLSAGTTTGYQVGLGVANGTGSTAIPANSFVKSITDSTHFTISQNLSGTLNGAVQVFGDQGAFVYQNVDALDAAGFQYGTSSAVTSKICFNVNSNIIGTASMMMLGYASVSAPSRAFAQTFPVTTTSARQCVSIPGDTGSNGAWAIPNAFNNLWAAVGFVPEAQGAGSACVLVSPGSWSNTPNACGAVGQTYNLMGQVGAWIDISAVKLELSPISTAFTPPDNGVELSKVQSTFEKSVAQLTLPGAASSTGVDMLFSVNSSPGTISDLGHTVRFKVTKRCPVPTITLYSPISGASGYAYDYTGAHDVAAYNNLITASDDGFGWYAAPYGSSATFKIGAYWTATCPF